MAHIYDLNIYIVYIQSLIYKYICAWKDWRQEGKRMTEDEMVGWYHWLKGHELEQVQGDGEREGILACCSLWGRKESNMTERLTNNKIYVALWWVSLKLNRHITLWNIHAVLVPRLFSLMFKCFSISFNLGKWRGI